MKKTRSGNYIVGCIIAIFFVAGNAWSAQDEKTTPGFAWKDGAEIYAKICAYCHDVQVGPPIRNRELPAAYIRAVVRNGRFAMPAFRAAEIDDESLTKLAEFISRRSTQP
ncbi:MAG: cytochrome c [Nitrosomonas sp.]|nr:MAG: cytochrome c [Nitrosomonas sp.]